MSALVMMLLAAKLEVSVTGLENDSGEVRVAVFASEKGWPEDDAQAIRRVVVKIVKGVATVTFDDLPAGTYAAVAFHDLDGDGKLKKGAFGAPKEPWGASNGARGTFGPKFSDAAFRVPAKLSIEVQR